MPTKREADRAVLGVVKFWNPKGWGAVSCPELPAGRDAWVVWSAVEVDGYTALTAGEPIEFTYHREKYESFDFVVDWARPVRPSPGNAPHR